MKIKMGKILFAALAFLGLQSSLQAKTYLETIRAGDQSYFKLASKGWLCGFVTLKPLEPLKAHAGYKEMKLVSYWSAGNERGGILGKLPITYDKANEGGSNKGLIIPFDYAGTSSDSHYRIYMEGQKADGTWVPVDITKYLAMKTGKYEGSQTHEGTERSCVLGYAIGGLPKTDRIDTALNLTDVQVTLTGLGKDWTRPHEFASDPELLKAMETGKFIDIGNPNGDIVGTLYNDSNKPIYVMMTQTLCDPEGLIWKIGIASATAIASIAATVATAGAASAVTAAIVAKAVGGVLATSLGGAKAIKAAIDTTEKGCGAPRELKPGEYALFKRWHPTALWAHQTYILFDTQKDAAGETKGDLLAMQGDIERGSLAIWDGKQLWFGSDKDNRMTDYTDVQGVSSGDKYNRIKNFTQGGKKNTDLRVWKALKGNKPTS